MHCVRVCVCPCIRVCVHVCRAQISVTFLISKAASVHGHEDDVDGDDDNDEQVDDSRTVFVDNSMILRCFHFMMRQLS